MTGYGIHQGEDDPDGGSSTFYREQDLSMTEAEERGTALHDAQRNP